jgi:opacity protein-like surface antigen
MIMSRSSLLLAAFFLSMNIYASSSSLGDGLYLGISGGYDVYTVKDNVDYLATQVSSFSLDPKVNAGGITAGGFLGYRRYFEHFFKTYLGVEFFIHGSSANTDDNIYLNNLETFSTEINVETNFGISLLPAIQLSPLTMLYLRLGYNWLKLTVDEANSDSSFFPYLGIDYHQFSNLHGFNYGIGIETLLLKNINFRFEYTYTKYGTFLTSIGTSITPSNNQFLAGLLYHF